MSDQPSVPRADRRDMTVIEGAAPADVALAALGVGAWRWNIEQDAVSVSASWRTLLKVGAAWPGDGGAAAVRALVHADDRLDVALRLDAAFAGDGRFESVHRMARGDGAVIWVEDIGVVTRRAGDGRPLEMAGGLRDVSGGRRTQEALAESETRLAELAANLPGALFSYILHPDGSDRFGFMSEGARAIWELPPDTVMADPSLVWAQVAPEDLPVMAASVRASAQSLRPWLHRWRSRAPSGAEKMIEGRGRPRRRADGAVVWHGFVIDVTEQMRLQDELDQSRMLLAHSQRMEAIGQLTGGMAHDFNNLLGVVLGNLELMQEDDDTARHPAYLREAIEATLRGRDLTRSLLSFARRAALEPEPIDLNGAIAGMQGLLRRVLPKSVALRVALAPDLAPAFADRSATENALLNLCLNARDAMPDGGRLTIETANLDVTEAHVAARNETIACGRYAVVAVTDTGVGMDAATRERAFDPFFTTKPVGQGSGLGLSTVMGFARQSGGTVRLYSEPGVGTTVRILFRHADAPPMPVEPPPEARRGAVALRVLLAEDDDAVRRAIRLRLEFEGVAVVEAASGDAALALFRAEGPFYLVLTDVVMPGSLQGPALARAIRDLAPGQRLCFMSGYPAEAAVHGNGLRPDDILLVKPLGRADLARALRHAAG